jgi:hypothetical protein
VVATAAVIHGRPGRDPLVEGDWTEADLKLLDSSGERRHDSDGGNVSASAVERGGDFACSLRPTAGNSMSSITLSSTEDCPAATASASSK